MTVCEMLKQRVEAANKSGDVFEKLQVDAALVVAHERKLISDEELQTLADELDLD